MSKNKIPFQPNLKSKITNLQSEINDKNKNSGNPTFISGYALENF